MLASSVDTLSFFEKLKSAGMPDNQAKVQVEIISEVMQANRQDLQAVETRLEAMIVKVDNKIDAAENRLEAMIEKVDSKIDKVEARLDAKLEKTSSKLETVITEVAKLSGEFVILKWMMGIVLAGISTLVIKAFL